ncbi:hypothetical protein V5F32_23230 [Xanthobacter oligotrophicus]|uniref:Uncharacterized protein n=1 Tax=Xanthobacter oligotrophicus TaxID=2607286 RepID=A0ABW7A538_9HYPH
MTRRQRIAIIRQTWDDNMSPRVLRATVTLTPPQPPIFYILNNENITIHLFVKQWRPQASRIAAMQSRVPGMPQRHGAVRGRAHISAIQRTPIHAPSII